MGYDESFEVLDDLGISVYEGSDFSTDDTQTMEECLDTTPSNKYKLVMKSFVPDGWDNTGYIAVYGINGNMVIKDAAFSQQTISEFSLYSPIRKGNVWKYSNAFAAGWTDYSFSDATWQNGVSTIESTGTEYFRKTFAGISNMAAIDVEFRYKFGIIAYINGVEIYRDNMPSTAVTADTLATGQYTSLEYRGVVRSAQLASSAQSVMAVELHFLEAGYQQPIDFMGFVSYLAPTTNTTTCYSLATSMTAAGPAFEEVDSIFDYSISYYSSAAASNLPATITMTFTGNVRPVVNGIRIWPYTEPTYGPTSFTLAGAETASQTQWTNVVTTENANYKPREWYELTTVADMTRFGAMRLTVSGTKESEVQIYEAQFLICNMQNKNIEYELAQDFYYKDYQSLSLHPTVLGFTNCQVNPALPQGVTLGSDCSITGTSAVSAPQTTFVLTATSGTQTATGSLTLSFPECSGSIYRLVRSYKSGAANEAYRIRNSVTDELLYEVAVGNTHASNQDRTEYICMTVDRFDVTVDSSSQFWARDSFIYVYSWLPEGEWELILRARFDAKQGNEVSYYLRRNTVNPVSDWYYKSGEVPANWYDDSTSGWTAYHRGTFPESSNGIQLYKKTFTVSDLSVVSGYILSIRYRYGCIVYLNGQEAWRNHVTGTLSASSVASESYQELKYRVVSLPGRSIGAGSSAQYLKQGTNTIAIALIALNPTSQKESHFDAVVRLMTNQQESHIWEYTTTKVRANAPLSNAFDGYYGTSYYYNKCLDNEGVLILDNDRREWVSSVEVQNSISVMTMNPKSFSLYGRNSASEEWTLLTEVDGLTFSLLGQKRRIYFANSKPYNQFKFANFMGDGANCVWRAQSLNLYADNVLGEQTPLSYPSNVEVYKDIEIAEVVPEGAGYSNYTITPDLPTGLVFDHITGWISGTTSLLMAPTTYTVTANKFTGGSSSVSFSLSVVVCTGGKALMTIRIRADGNPNENSWKLFSGRGTEGTLLQSVNPFIVKNVYYYVDNCLMDGLYTFAAYDAFGDGWTAGTGYTLTVDSGAMEMDMRQVPSGRKPVESTLTFSSYIPFQTEYSDWKVYQNIQAVDENWKSVDFDDASWTETKASNITNLSDVVTTYIRKTFSIPNLEDYQVLNVRVRYGGGVAAYFNGKMVARLNLEEEFTASTESIALHDPTVFSKFHIILATNGATEEKNVIAFEIHRPVGSSSSTEFAFDATGVFGVETCSAVLDTYATLTGSETQQGELVDAMNLDPVSIAKLDKLVGTNIEWTVENLLGTDFNAFVMMTQSTLVGFAFDLNAWYTTAEDEEPITALRFGPETLMEREHRSLEAPVGLAGFQKLRFEITGSPNNNPMPASIHLEYCKATGTICPAVGLYPAVAEGQISVSECPAGYTGYSYRTCADGQLGEVETDHCKYKAPAKVRYPRSIYHFVMDTNVATEKPTYENIVTRWFMDDSMKLPAGLTLNEETGEITGKPTEEREMTTYRIYASNPSRTVAVEVQLDVRKGKCIADGVFQSVEVGTEAVYECSNQGRYVGTKRRQCVLGETDGEWGQASGLCVSVLTIVILILVVIVVIVVIVFVVVRMSRKTKAVGGVKGKKVLKTEKVDKKKVEMKSVKVCCVCW